jgi:HK97 family phage major capsid protein
LYGDLAAALIIKATPDRVAVSRDFLFDKDQVAIKTVHRLDGAVQDAAAAAYLVSANS